jgi:hypothetical protein
MVHTLRNLLVDTCIKFGGEHKAALYLWDLISSWRHAASGAHSYIITGLNFSAGLCTVS